MSTQLTREEPIKSTIISSRDARALGDKISMAFHEHVTNETLINQFDKSKTTCKRGHKLVIVKWYANTRTCVCGRLQNRPAILLPAHAYCNTCRRTYLSCCYSSPGIENLEKGFCGHYIPDTGNTYICNEPENSPIHHPSFPNYGKLIIEWE